MSQVLPDDVDAVLGLATAEPSPLLREMTDHGDERGFPTVGPVAGRILRLLAKFADARRVFEFGSGFGYSAAWFAGAMPAMGEIVLTDYDEDNLDEARSFLDRMPDPPEFHYEAGDALDTYTEYEGPFDVVLVDHDKERYVEAFELARDDVAHGGVVVADNMLAGPVDPAGVRATLEGADPPDDATRGVVDYLERVRDDPEFETVVLPVGEGLAVSRKSGT